MGTVEQGTLLPGDVIGIVPSGLRDKKIFSIEQHKKTLDKASPGDSVGLSIKGISKDEKVNPGDIIYVQKDGDLKPINPKKKITGFTIVEALNNFIVPPKRHPELPVRLPISNIHNIKGVGQIICGTVEQGTLLPGDVIGIVPSGLRDKKIFSIEQHKKTLDRPARETLLVFPSRVFPRTRRSTLVTSSMCRRMAILNPSRVSPALLLGRSTLVSSSLDMLPLSSAVPPRLRVR